MPTELLEPAPLAAPGNRGPGWTDRPDDGGPSPGGESTIFGNPARFGLLAFMGTASMLFIGFTSAYILRRSSPDWQPLSAPPLLYLNTAILLSSSATAETARRRLKAWDLAGMNLHLALTGLLGVLFVLGQFGAWRELAAEGIFLATNPHSSFFYVLTGAHIVHLLGGLVWFGMVFVQARRMALAPGHDGLALFATYWHFLGALWIYLLFLLFVW